MAAPAQSASGVARTLTERPELVSMWHLVPVIETSRVVSGLSGARYDRMQRQRGGPMTASKRVGLENISLNLHVLGMILLKSKSAVK